MLFRSVYNTLNKIPKKTILPKVEIKKVVSIEEMIDKLTERINKALKMSFKDFSDLSINKKIGASVIKEKKITMIISFLAMLELVRRGILNVIQENNFEDIFIEKQRIAYSDR